MSTGRRESFDLGSRRSGARHCDPNPSRLCLLSPLAQSACLRSLSTFRGGAKQNSGGSSEGRQSTPLHAAIRNSTEKVICAKQIPSHTPNSRKHFRLVLFFTFCSRVYMSFPTKHNKARTTGTYLPNKSKQKPTKSRGELPRQYPLLPLLLVATDQTSNPPSQPLLRRFYRLRRLLRRRILSLRPRRPGRIPPHRFLHPLSPLSHPRLPSMRCRRPLPSPIISPSTHPRR